MSVKQDGHTTKTCPTPYFLFQLFLSVSTQISPAFDTFGWKIRVIIVPIALASWSHSCRADEDIHLGGRFGYSGPNSNRTRKYPPSYGVPAIPISTFPISLPGIWLSSANQSCDLVPRPQNHRMVKTRTWPLDPSFHSCKVLLIHYDPDSLWRLIP